MYPSRDFRELIKHPNVPKEVLIRSLAREPFTEILHYWNVTNKPAELLDIYRQGIEDAIARDRYPLYQLQIIEPYSEFYTAIMNGLKRLWTALRFSIQGKSILIDSVNGDNVNISNEDKLRILDTIPYRMNTTLLINHKPQNIGLFVSKNAERIYQQVNWLKSLISHS